MPDYSIAFWNLENLFAPAGHPGREPWIADAMRRDLTGWTEALFTRKLEQLSRVIRGMNGGAGPDILGVCEVENAFVLDRLTQRIQADGGRAYAVIHADATRDHRGIDTAFLYDPARFTADPALIFSHFVLRRTGTRDISQATFRTGAGNDLIVMCNHWPSRSGGAEKSAGFRATAGETLAYWHERIREEVGDRAALIALGDFNDDPFDPSVRFNALGWRERGDVERARSAKLYNLSWNYLRQDLTDHRGNPRQVDGTLYYGNDGNLFDQILVARPLLDGAGPFAVEDATAGIDAIPAMVSHRKGEGPFRFGLPKGNAAANVNEDGFSDHFPISVIVREA